MRVLHVNDVAGVASDICRVQRELGHESMVMAHRRYSMVEPDVQLYLDGFVCINLELLMRSGLFRKADIIHVHGGMRRSQLAFRFLKKHNGAKWVVHYHGSETRMGYGIHHADLADTKIVSTPDLARWHPGAIWLPNPIPEVLLPPTEPRGQEKETLLVGHFPSKRHLKGTDDIIKALEPLVEMGLVNLVIREGKSHHEIIETIRCMDVVIDQLTDLGIFSKVALEAMALGVPAISSYDGSLFPEDCPVIATNSKAELTETVRKIANQGVSEGLKQDSVRYVRRYHDPVTVAQRLTDVYRSVLGLLA